MPRVGTDDLPAGFHVSLAPQERRGLKSGRGLGRPGLQRSALQHHGGQGGGVLTEQVRGSGRRTQNDGCGDPIDDVDGVVLLPQAGVLPVRPPQRGPVLARLETGGLDDLPLGHAVEVIEPGQCVHTRIQRRGCRGEVDGGEGSGGQAHRTGGAVPAVGYADRREPCGEFLRHEGLHHDDFTVARTGEVHVERVIGGDGSDEGGVHAINVRPQITSERLDPPISRGVGCKAIEHLHDVGAGGGQRTDDVDGNVATVGGRGHHAPLHGGIRLGAVHPGTSFDEFRAGRRRGGMGRGCESRQRHRGDGHGGGNRLDELTQMNLLRCTRGSLVHHLPIVHVHMSPTPRCR